jgi:hypothetical protein
LQPRIAPGGQRTLLVRYTVKGSTPSASTACLKNTATPLGSSSFLPHAQKPGVPVPWLDNASTGESPEDAKESRTARGTVHGPAARQSARPCACAPALIQIDMQWASPRSVPTRPDLDIRLARYGGPAADTESQVQGVQCQEARSAKAEHALVTSDLGHRPFKETSVHFI